jgi:hypothetical protein
MNEIAIQESKNVEVVAHHPMEKRPLFKMALQEVAGRWYLYAGHIWHAGWSIVEVTDPYKPELVKWIEGPSNTWTTQVQVADGKLVTSLEKIGTWLPQSRSEMWGHDANEPWDEGVVIWDVKNPTEPKRLGQFRTGGFGTHRNYYAGGRYVHLAANMSGYKTNVYVVIDISDPTRPKETARWSMTGQGNEDKDTEKTPGSLHGPAYVVGNRAWLPYGRRGAVLLDISDITKPRFVSRFSIGDFGSVIGCHTYLPIPERGLAAITTEAILEDGGDSANLTAILDVSDETRPRAVAILPTPTPSAQAPYDGYAARGGKFGPHNLHMPHHQACYAPVRNLLHLTYFCAGLRIYDIRDPYQAREVGYFVPADPQERLGRPYLPTRLIPQYEDVLIDARGFIYVSDKNYGLTVLRYTGPNCD